MNKAQILMEKIKSPELVIGGHVFLTDPAISEAMGYYGYDFIWIDAEHGAFDKEKILANIMAANSAGAASIVRVVWNDSAIIKPILEMGPDGIIIPMVCTREEAENAVAACLYPPKGIRGFGPRRANHYGAIPTGEYLKNAEESFLRIVQIEHIDAVKNIDEILSVDGIDAIIVGPNDLSASIGLLGNTKHPDVSALCDEISMKCKNHNMPFGVSLGPDDKDSIKAWIGRGISFISCGDDISFIGMGAQETIRYIKNC